MDQATVMHGSWQVEATLPVKFVVESHDDLFALDNETILEWGSRGAGARRIVIIDERVYDLFGDKIENYLIHHGIEHRLVPIACTETSKDLDTLLAVVEALENFHVLRRSEPVIAIGGGVLLDIVGLAASTYQRGVPYIRVPTTLLALVDASVGAKTAINHLGRRNRLGTYYPPVAAYLDRSFLLTLDRREFSNGLGEILKMGLLKDRRLFELLEEHGPALINQKFQKGEIPIDVINRAVGTMLEELEPNLWEENLERIVDFGHSFSPLLEMRALPALSHGEAVTLDMLFSCLISRRRGMLADDELERIFATVVRLELPVFHPSFADPEALSEALADTVIHRNGAQNLPMLEAIGKTTFLNDVTPEEIALAANELRERTGGSDQG